MLTCIDIDQPCGDQQEKTGGRRSSRERVVTTHQELGCRHDTTENKRTSHGVTHEASADEVRARVCRSCRTSRQLAGGSVVAYVREWVSGWVGIR